MALETTVEQVLAALLHEANAYHGMSELYEKYKALSPEEIASPAHFQQAVKDQQLIDAAAKSINAAMPSLKKLASYTETLVKGFPETSQMLASTLIKLHAVGKAAPQINSSLSDIKHRAMGWKGAITQQLNAGSQEAHPKILQYAIKDDTHAKLYGPASEAGDHWQKARSALTNAQIAMITLEGLVDKASD